MKSRIYNLKFVTSDGKNYTAIEKIIAHKSYRDYKAALERHTRHYKRKRFEGYTLAQDTLEAIEVKHNYLSCKITEEEYKAYCLKENLLVE